MDRLLNIASLSYGKDSLAQLEIMHRNGIPIDGILTADIWATKEIPAYLPELADFRNRMDYEIEKRYGVEVTHAKASKTFEECFFRERSSRSQYDGIWGWPPVFGHWCMRILKAEPLQAVADQIGPSVAWIGIAADEPQRHNQLNETKRSALVEYGITEAMAMDICKDLGWVSPTYMHSGRDGCWFCPCQGIDQLRRLYREFPEYWALMMKWDSAEGQTNRFKIDHTLMEYDKRFRMEEAGELREDIPFEWAMLEEPVQLKFIK